MKSYEKFFKQHIHAFKVSGKNQATGLCPFHEDKKPSFSCNIEDGLWKCFGCGKSGNVFQFAKLLNVEPLDVADKGTCEVARYTYHDKSGKPLFQVRKYFPKTFRFYRTDGNGEWLSGLNGALKVLYNLPEVIKSSVVYVVEGEKDVETARKLKIVATTNPCGATHWKDEYSEYLKGKSVVIIPDQDESGKKHSLMVAQSLQKHARAIKIVNPPNGKDLTEYIEKGGGRATLVKLVKETDIYAGKPTDETNQKTNLKLVSLKDLLAEPEEETDWIVDGMLPKGGLSVIVAKPKVGKSTIARQLALCVARGEEFFTRETEAGLTIYLAFEERRSDVQRHFKQMGAGDENLKVFAGMAPADVIVQVREMAKQEKPALIIIDTLARIARIKDLNDYSQTTAGLEPLLAIAREGGSHVCLLHHAKKGNIKGLDSILGSTGIAGSVDAIICLDRNEKYRTVSTIQRNGRDLEETVLNFDADRRWTTLGGSREEIDIGKFKEAIVGFLKEQAESVPELLIDEGIEGNRSHRKKALRELVKEGKVERLGGGKKNNPYLYKNAGILVLPISSEPENQNPENEITTQNDQTYSSSENLAFCDSGSTNNAVELPTIPEGF